MELVIADSGNAPDVRLVDLALLRIDREMSCVWLWAEELKKFERGKVLYLFNLDSPYGSIPTNLARLNWNWCYQGLAVFRIRQEVFELHFDKARASSQFSERDHCRKHLSSLESGQTLLSALKSASEATNRNLLMVIVELACQYGSFRESEGTLEAYLNQIRIPDPDSGAGKKEQGPTRTSLNPQSANFSTQIPSPPLPRTEKLGTRLANPRKRAKELLILSGHSGGIRSVAWSTDSERLATGSEDGTARVWDAATGEELISVRGHSVAWSPDGQRLATVPAPDSTARIWDAQTGKALLSLGDKDEKSWSVAWSPDGKFLATGRVEPMLRTKVWDAQTGKVKLILQGEDGECRCIAWSPDGHRIATANFQTYRGADGLYTAKIWNAVTGEEFLSLSALHKGRFLSVAWSPDGSLMATGMEAGTTQVWDAETGKSLLTLSGNKEIVTSVVWSPDGKFIATVSGVNTAAVWNAETGNRLFTLRGHNRPVRSVAWSPNGKRLATGSLDGTAKVWDVEMDS